MWNGTHNTNVNNIRQQDQQRIDIKKMVVMVKCFKVYTLKSNLLACYK